MLKYFLNSKEVISYTLKFFLGILNFKLLYRTLKKFYALTNNFSYVQLSFTFLLQKDSYYVPDNTDASFLFLLQKYFYICLFFIFISAVFAFFLFFFLRKILVYFTCFFFKLFFVFLIMFMHHIKIQKNTKEYKVFLIVIYCFYIYTQKKFIKNIFDRLQKISFKM